MRVDIALITGYHIQKNQFVEIGIGIKRNGVAGHHPNTLIYGLSNEFKVSDDFIWGLKAGINLGGGAAGTNIGFNLIYYTDFENSSLRFRPETGIGYSFFRVVYGYNLAITNSDFPGINKHNFGVNIFLNLKNIKTIKDKS